MKTMTKTNREVIKHPGVKGQITWKHHTEYSHQVCDTTKGRGVRANVWECGTGNWSVSDRTGREDGTDPVRSMTYKCATPYAAWELYMAEFYA